MKALCTFLSCLFLSSSWSVAGFILNPFILSPAGGTSYSNPGGTGNRTASITTTTGGGSFIVGAASVLVDGAQAAGLYFGVTGAAGNYFQFDFGAKKIIDEIRWINSGSFEHGVVKMQGSNNGSSFVDLGSSFTLGSAGAATSTHAFANSVGYRYYRLEKVSGAWNTNPWLYELEFKIANGPVTSYANTGGTGARSGVITMSQTFGYTMLGAGVLIDGNTANTGCYLYSIADGDWFQFDFGSAKIIDEVTWYQQTTATHGTWKIQGSNDNSSFTDVGNSFTFGGTTTQTITEVLDNSTGYRYYRFTKVSGAVVSIWIYEAEFKITAP